MKKAISTLLALVLGLSLAVLPASALELEEAKELLAVYYVDGVPPEVLELDSLDAILEALGDPYTYYMTPEQYDWFKRAFRAAFSSARRASSPATCWWRWTVWSSPPRPTPGPISWARRGPPSPSLWSGRGSGWISPSPAGR